MSGFAKKLRQAREAKGLSQYGLAKSAGLSKQAVSSLELGVNDPSWDTVQKLAAALGVDCTAFAGDVTIPESEPAKGRGRPRKEQTPAPSPAKRKPRK